MKIELKELDSCRRELKIIVPAETAQKEYRALVNIYKSKVNVPGFRKGKAPLKMIEQLYSEYFSQEFIMTKAEDFYKQALQENDIHPISEADIVDTSWKIGEDFIATYKFDVIPVIDNIVYEGLDVYHKDRDFDIAELDNALTKIQNQMATHEPAETIDQDCIIHASFTETEPQADAEEDAGEKPPKFEREFEMSVNIYSQDLNSKLIGKKAGDTIYAIIFDRKEDSDDEIYEPALYEKELRIKILEIKKTVLPELNDELAKDTGFESLEDLKATITRDIKQKIEKFNEKEKNKAVEEALIQANPIEIPEAIIKDHAFSMAEDAAAHYNIDPKSIVSHFIPAAEWQMKGVFLKDKLAKQINIEATEEDKMELIKEVAANLNLDVEKYQELYEEEIGSEDFEFTMITRKVMNIIAEKAVFHDPPEDDKQSEDEQED